MISNTVRVAKRILTDRLRRQTQPTWFLRIGSAYGIANHSR